MNYWTDKTERSKQARKHIEDMTVKYPHEIAAAIGGTKIYGPERNEEIETEEKSCELIIEELDTVSSLLTHIGDGIVAAQNFSSYKNPGGMFLDGSSAQEECLCMDSTLYPVLASAGDTFYEWNRKNKNKAMYLNRALYSPGIIFEDKEGNPVKCDVITCAAPNVGAAMRYGMVSAEENTGYLRGRIKFIKSIAEDNNVETLIAGAYGCGVFKQDPNEVASLYKEIFATSKTIKKVIFAIPGGKNLEVFRSVLGL